MTACDVLFKLSDVLNEDRSLVFGDLEDLLGRVVLNRVVGVAYKNITKNKHNNYMPREFYDTIDIMHQVNMRKTDAFIQKIRHISGVLAGCGFDYALLKGAYLSLALYEHGLRTSNDVDILVCSDNVSKCEALLVENGFQQGNLSRDRQFVKATRRDVVNSKLNNGETIPFVKFIDGEPLEVDINFSLDFKPPDSKEGDIVPVLLKETIPVQYDGFSFNILNYRDFLIHLCCHLFKEATTYDWVERRRDLLLYKFSDINVFLNKHGNDEFFASLLERINLFKVEEKCFYTFENSSVIYPNMNKIPGFVSFKDGLVKNRGFMNKVYKPSEKKFYEHDMSFKEWFWEKDRPGRLTPCDDTKED